MQLTVISADRLNAFHVGRQVYVPALNVRGSLSDATRTLTGRVRLFVGGRIVTVNRRTRILF